MSKDDSRGTHWFTLVSLGAAALMAAWAGPASAQTNSALLVAPFPKDQVINAEGGAAFLEGGHAQKTDEDLQLSLYGAYGRVRLQPGELKSPRVGFDITYLDLHTSFDGLPDRLIDQSVAIGFPVWQYEDWIFGASVGVGYAGDSFFGDGDAYYALASAVAFRQLDEHSALVFLLDYDGNRTFLPDIPLPGVAYTRVLQERLEMTAGLPVSSIRWRPTDQLTLELAYYIPEDVRVDIGYEVLPHFVLFGRARQQRKGFFVDGLPENHDRILFEQRRAEAGIRYEPTEQVNLDLAIGYAWGGEFSEGFDSRDTTEITDISDEPYIRAGVQIRF
jgi:hypothetical protein